MESRRHPISQADLAAELRLLNRVRDLIRLASSSNENESRTAAAKACEMIRENGLLIAPAHAERALQEHARTNERLIRGIEACRAAKARP
jgi:hypothetical protein